MLCFMYGFVSQIYQKVYIGKEKQEVGKEMLSYMMGKGSWYDQELLEMLERGPRLLCDHMEMTNVEGEDGKKAIKGSKFQTIRFSRMIST